MRLAMASSCVSEPTTTPFLIASRHRSSSPLAVSPDDAKTQVDRGGRFDHAGGLELDVFATGVLEHLGAAPEEHGYEVDPDLIHQPRLDELPADVGAAHHGDVLVPGGRLRLF